MEKARLHYSRKAFAISLIRVLLSRSFVVLSAFITSESAAVGELGKCQKEDRGEADVSLQIVNRAEHGLLVVPEQRETCSPLTYKEARPSCMVAWSIFPAVTLLSSLDLEESVSHALFVRSRRSCSVPDGGTIGLARADTV